MNDEEKTVFHLRKCEGCGKPYDVALTKGEVDTALSRWDSTAVLLGKPTIACVAEAHPLCEACEY